METKKVKQILPLNDPYELGEDQWMVPCIIDSFQRKFIPLSKPTKPKGDSGLRVSWTDAEDSMLRDLTLSRGVKKWTALSRELNKHFHRGEDIRQGKQCRERWYNHLNPELKKADWTREEDEMILQKQEVYGNKWSLISKALPGRTENSVKNRWKSIVRKNGKEHSASEEPVRRVESGGERGQGEGTETVVVTQKPNLASLTFASLPNLSNPPSLTPSSFQMGSYRALDYGVPTYQSNPSNFGSFRLDGHIDDSFRFYSDYNG